MAYLLLLPLLFAVARLKTGKYVFSALTTISAGLIALTNLASLSAVLIACALFVSAGGDYFMAHRFEDDRTYVFGIGGFFVAHVLLIASATARLTFSPMALVAGLLLCGLYMAFLKLHVLPEIPQPLKLPAAAYTLISIAGFTLSLMTGDVIYASALALLLFSDTMIAEADFAGNRCVDRLVLPTYYLCHILAATSAILIN